MFFISCAYDETPPENVGVISAESEEDVCKKLGINPKEYFKGESFKDGEVENGYALPGTDWTISFIETKEIANFEELAKCCVRSSFSRKLFQDMGMI